MNRNFIDLENAETIYNTLNDHGLFKYYIDCNRVIIGYNALSFNICIKEIAFYEFLSMINGENEEMISFDDITFFKYKIGSHMVTLWDDKERIDIITKTGNTKNNETWMMIRDEYLTKKLKNEIKRLINKKINENKIKKKCDNNGDNETKTETKNSDSDENKNNNTKPVTLYVDKLPSLEDEKWNYWGYNKRNLCNAINSGEYTVTDNNTNKDIKIKIKDDIDRCYKHTKYYDGGRSFKFMSTKQIDNVYRNYENMSIEIVNESTLESIFRIKKEDESITNLIALNFGSEYFDMDYIVDDYEEEQRLLSNTSLHHSLCKYGKKMNQICDDTGKDKHLYTHEMVYSPNVVILRKRGKMLNRDDVQYCSFITSVPVNAGKYFKDNLKDINVNNIDYKKIKKQQNKKKKNKEINKKYIKIIDLKERIDDIMTERIRRIIEVAILNGGDALILGAFGCNDLHKNDVKKIAKTFKKLISTIYYNCFKRITFSIYDDSYGNDNNNNNTNNKNNINNLDAFGECFAKTFGNV